MFLSGRQFLKVSVGTVAAAAVADKALAVTALQPGRNKTMDINKKDTAVVFIDPKNEVLSDKGLAWAAVGQSVKENKTIENMERIFKAAKENGFEVFISPHYFFPTDRGWKFNGYPLWQATVPGAR